VEKYATATASDATNVTVVEVWLTDTPITLKHIVQ
jgi:cell division protein FtsI (penicillin-binding protein 3)